MAAPARPHGAAGQSGGLDELLVRSGSGDTAAFTELYDRLAPRVFGLVCCLVQDAAEAEALTHDAFVEAWRRAPTYDPASGGAVSWVLVLARRVAVPASRRAPRAGSLGTTANVHDTFLLGAGLTGAQARAVRLAWYDGLDRRRIGAELDTDAPVAALITAALRALEPAGTR